MEPCDAKARIAELELELSRLKAQLAVNTTTVHERVLSSDLSPAEKCFAKCSDYSCVRMRRCTGYAGQRAMTDLRAEARGRQ